MPDIQNISVYHSGEFFGFLQSGRSREVLPQEIIDMELEIFIRFLFAIHLLSPLHQLVDKLLRRFSK